MTPTHVLKAFDKTNEARTEVGAGWLNPNGTISITLNPCVVLTRHPNIVYTLFPNTKKKGRNAKNS